MGFNIALPLVLLAIPGTAILVAARLLFGTTLESRSSPARLSVSLAGWILIWFAIIGGILAVCGPTPVALVVTFMLILVVLMVWVRHKRNEHRALIGVIAAGMKRGIPVPESARAMADETGGRTGVRAMRLAQAVEAGVPLDQAIAQARLWLSTGTLVAARMGCAVGRAGDALQRELEAGRSLEDVARPLVPRILYLLSLVNVGIALLTFMVIKIVPVYEVMFQQFELELPPVTTVLIEISSALAGELSPLVFFVWLALAHLFAFGVLMYIGVVPRDLPLPRWVYRSWDRRWAVTALLVAPLRALNWLFRRYDGSIVLRSLAWAVERGVPLPQALRLVGNVYPLSGVRWQVLWAAEQVERGASWCQSLRDVRLIGAVDVGVLMAAQRAGNLVWAMNEVSDSLLRREVYRWQWWYNIASPIAIVLFGVAVGFICIALFLPLVALIEGMLR
ncbi:MAG TPA: type II secretion system F family protein [Pirellulaceae bacterium]|nr:type II secretion system F family protein [Pirellulaceae bacterium]